MNERGADVPRTHFTASSQCFSGRRQLDANAAGDRPHHKDRDESFFRQDERRRGGRLQGHCTDVRMVDILLNFELVVRESCGTRKKA